jgi:hypothetical protein
MKPHNTKALGDHELHTLEHEATAGKRNERVVPQVCRLKRAANNLGDVDHARQLGRICNHQITFSVSEALRFDVLPEALEISGRRNPSFMKAPAPANRFQEFLGVTKARFLNG